MSDAFDCAIIGGGLVGATCAVALARSGRSVALVEARARPDADPTSSAGRTDPQRHQDGGQDQDPKKGPETAGPETRLSHDDRTLVINAASLNILANLELLPDPAVRCPIGTIDISRQGGFGRLTLRAADHGREEFGQVIVARELGLIALDAIQQNGRITEFCPDRLATWATHPDSISLRLESGAELTTRLLIGADGNDSLVREQAGLACRRHAYGQSAMIFNVRPERSTPTTAFERFTPRGPLALLPQPQGRMGVVWIDGDPEIDEAMAWDDAELSDRLQRRFGPRMGRFKEAGRRARYPLIRQRTPCPIAERLVVIGNAANAVHPVSAQGFNLGLRDVAGLVDALTDRDDPGDSSALRDYFVARREDQAATVRYTDTLARAFTNPSGLARLGAGLGIVAHAGLPGLRHRLVHAAMGFRPPVASLARRQPERNAPGT